MTPQEELKLLEAVAAAKSPKDELAAREALERAKSPPGFSLDKAGQAVKDGVGKLGGWLTRGLAGVADVYSMTGSPGLGGGLAQTMLANRGENITPGAAAAADRRFPVKPDEGIGEMLARKFTEGVGGVAAMGPAAMAQAPVTTAVAGGTANAASELAGLGVERLGPRGEPTPPMLQKGADAARFLTGLAAGPLTTYGISGMTGVRQSAGMRDLRQAVSPKELAELERNLRLLERQGLPSITPADAAPETSGIRSLADAVRGLPGGEALRDKLSGRQGDLDALTGRMVGAPVPGGTAGVAERASQVANQVLGKSKSDAPDARGAGGLREFRSLAYDRRFDMPGSDTPIPGVLEQLAQRLARDMRDPQRGQSQLTRDAYEQLAGAVLSPDKVVIPQPPKVQTTYPKRAELGRPDFRIKQVTETAQPPLVLNQANPSIRAAAGEVKQLQTQANSGQPFSINGGKNINAGAAKRGLGIADGTLRDASPQYASAQDGFRAITENLINPTLQGPVGILAGRNVRPEQVPVPSTRLGTAFSGQDPLTIERTLQGLGRFGQGRGPEGQPVAPNVGLPGQIVDAIMQQRVAKNPQDAGAALRGAAGSAQEAELMALQRGAGRDPAALQQQLQASDLLQGLARPAQVQTPMTLPWYSWALRPFRTMDIRGVGAADTRRRAEIAAVLSEPGGLRKLQEAAMFDPNLRREIAVLSAMVPLTQE